MSLRKNEAQMLAMLDRGVNAFDRFNADDAVPMSMPYQNNLRLAAQPGNPAFTAQFDLQILIRYFTESSGTYTARTAAYVLATLTALATQLPVFIFGNSDYNGGFRKSQGQFPLSGGWTYANNQPFIYGLGPSRCAFGNLDATVTGQFQVGDLVLPVTAVLSGPVNVLGVVIVRCAQVAYGTMLDALNSDVFWLNNVRYIINDSGQLTQFNNAIYIQSQSLFGKFRSDSVSPTSFKQPEQFQNGIIDIPINKGIDKNVIFGFYANYGATDLQLSIFVRQVNKLQA